MLQSIDARPGPASPCHEVATQTFVAVLNGATLRQLASGQGVAPSTIEKRFRRMERRLRPAVRIAGYAAGQAVPLPVMRQHKAQYLHALANVLNKPPATSAGRALTDDEFQGVVAVARSNCATGARDIALVYTLFGTGLLPREIARLQIRDFLQADGDVRPQTMLRPETAWNGRTRPLVWPAAVIEAIEDYLQVRAINRHGLGQGTACRSFAPKSVLFLSADGNALVAGRNHLLDIYRRIFERSGLAGVSTRSARRTLAQKLAARGATEREIGEVLGIQRRASVRALIAATRPPLAELLRQVIE